MRHVKNTICTKGRNAQSPPSRKDKNSRGCHCDQMKSFKNKNTYSFVHIKQKKLVYLFLFLLTFYEGEVCNVKLSEELISKR